MLNRIQVVAQPKTKEMGNLVSEDEVRSLIKSGRTHHDVSILLQTKYSGIIGVSERSVRRFCKRHDIHRRSHEALNEEVARAVAEVGPSYGRKTMTGLL